MKQNKFHAENSQILDTTGQNLVATATCRTGFLNPCTKLHSNIVMQGKLAQTITILSFGRQVSGLYVSLQTNVRIKP